jgi:hypothetical protein
VGVDYVSKTPLPASPLGGGEYILPPPGDSPPIAQCARTRQNKKRRLIMGKYLLYGVIVLTLLFTANFFGIIHISWLDTPFATKKSYYTEGTDKKNDAVKEIFNNSK